MVGKLIIIFFEYYFKTSAQRRILLCAFSVNSSYLFGNQHIHTMLVRNTTAVAVENPLLIFMEQPIVKIHKQFTRLPTIHHKFAFFRVGRQCDKGFLYTCYNMVSAIDTHFHRRMLLFYCKEKGHLSSKSVLYSLFRYGLRFLRHYNSFYNACLRPYPLFAPAFRGGFTILPFVRISFFLLQDLLLFLRVSFYPVRLVIPAKCHHSTRRIY